MGESNKLNINRYSVSTAHLADAKRAAVINNGKNAYNAASHSTQELYPNVVRIEPLGYHTRLSYLGAMHRAAEAVKYAIAEQMNPDAFKPFYGIISPDEFSNVGFTLGSEWKDVNGAAGVDKAAAILSSPAIAIPMGATLGETVGEKLFDKGDAGFKAGAVGGGALSLLGGAMSNTGVGKFTTKVREIAKGMRNRLGNGDNGVSAFDTFGIDPSSTGSATMKYFYGSSFQPIQQITVSWYMPEQEDLFRLSIRRLIQLAYVRDMKVNNQDEFCNKLKRAVTAAANASFVGVSDMLNEASDINENVKHSGNAVNMLAGNEVASLGEGAAEAYNAGSEAIAKGYGVLDDGLNAVKDRANANANQVGANADFANGKFADSNKQNFVGNSNNAVTQLLNTLLSAERFLGYNHTLMPFPVRLTIGNVLDIEPLVITRVNISNSKETFVNSIGAHIPITVTAKIEFQSWLTPGPNHDFIRYMGDNLFTPLPGDKIKGGK